MPWIVAVFDGLTDLTKPAEFKQALLSKFLADPVVTQMVDNGHSSVPGDHQHDFVFKVILHFAEAPHPDNLEEGLTQTHPVMGIIEARESKNSLLEPPNPRRHLLDPLACHASQVMEISPSDTEEKFTAIGSTEGATKNSYFETFSNNSRDLGGISDRKKALRIFHIR
ncbi:hypothetical protein B0H13DRAFT_1855125 [Mycena leptocephala]|nr:hypothetical protein B0H13DRAFT_1855125 [Mycena leptocephala]